jgi:hypothetical protein
MVSQTPPPSLKSSRHGLLGFKSSHQISFKSIHAYREVIGVASGYLICAGLCMLKLGKPGNSPHHILVTAPQCAASDQHAEHT